MQGGTVQGIGWALNLAALANAIYQVVGVRMDRLPMSPGAILAALQREQGQEQTPAHQHD
jgi:CO/xanthine dehydrogenase Mo-binding subunit